MQDMDLRTLASVPVDYDDDDDKHIDFGSVGLYLAGFQTCAVTLCCSATSVVCCWLLATSANSAVRTLALTTAVGIVLMRRPIRIGRVRGVRMIFNALRPCVPVYVLALVVEQLVHTCAVAPLVGPESKDSTGSGTFWNFHVHPSRFVCYTAGGLMLMSGMLRAHAPRSESDISFIVSLLCLLLMALLPPESRSTHGPLCESVDGFVAAERLLRAGTFSTLYVTLVYAAAPHEHVTNELLICVARAAAASLWIVVVPLWLLAFAPIQWILIVASSVGHNAESTNACSVDEQTYLSPIPKACSATYTSTCADSCSDGETTSVYAEDSDVENFKLAVAQVRASRCLSHPISSASVNSFPLGLQFPTTESFATTTPSISYRATSGVEVTSCALGSVPLHEIIAGRIVTRDNNAR